MLSENSHRNYIARMPKFRGLFIYVRKIKINKFMVGLLIGFSSISFAQNFPFPQHTNYSQGYLPTTITSADALTAYQVWKTNQLETCPNGSVRVKYDNPAETVSEGIAYGMLLSAYHGDKGVFDGIWQYYKNHLNTRGIMDWKIAGCTGTRLGNNGATDAELDVAYSLIVANKQWGTYLSDAQTMISKIKNFETIVSPSGLHVLKPGDNFGGVNCINASYLSPAYYDVFAKITPTDSTFWKNMARDAYVQLNANANATTGLVSDWQNAVSGAPGDAGCGVNYAFQGKNYSYDACRTPWRFGLDYLWGKNTGLAYLNKVSNFVAALPNGIASVKDGFNQNGTITGQYHNAPFVGAFAIAAMSTSQQRVDNFGLDFKNIPVSYEVYFGKSLRAIYMLVLTGNFWNPITAKADCSKCLIVQVKR